MSGILIPESNVQTACRVTVMHGYTFEIEILTGNYEGFVFTLLWFLLLQCLKNGFFGSCNQSCFAVDDGALQTNFEPLEMT